MANVMPVNVGLNCAKHSKENQVPRSRLFVYQYEMTFRQLANCQFTPHLAATRKSMSPRNESEGIFENFPFRWFVWEK